MKRSHKIGLGVLVFSLVSLLLLGGVIVSFCSAMIEKIRYENIIGIATALTVYTHDYNTLPEMDKWCDLLIAEADCSPSTFEGVLKPESGVCGYALNKNLAGLAFDALDDKVVLAFEAKGPWNLSGGPELVQSLKRKKIAVVFVDGMMKFVTKEEIGELKWTP
jgi:hypothetical protein